MPNFVRAVCSRCKVMSMANHFTAVPVSLTSKALLLTIAAFSFFWFFKINYPADCLQQRTWAITRECSVTVSAECTQFSVTYNLFTKSNPWSFSWECSRSSTSRLHDSQEGSLVIVHTTMIQTSAALSSASLFL